MLRPNKFLLENGLCGSAGKVASRSILSLSYGLSLLLAIAGSSFLSPSQAQAMPRCTGTDLITNGGFELPTHPPGTNFFNELEADVPGWSTTDTVIEIWQSGHTGVPSHTGVQHAEINATDAGTLTNTPIPIQENAEVLIYWVHRGRGGVDEGALAVTDDGGGATNPPNFLTGTADWVEYSAIHLPAAGSTTMTLAFTAVATGSGDLRIGNFLDTVEVCQTYLDFDKSFVSITDVDGSGTDSIDDLVNYQFLITNPAGNERGLTNVQILDDVIGRFVAVPTSGDDGDNILEPGETWVVNRSYALTLPDLDATVVTNIAHAEGDTGDNVLISPQDTVTVNLTSAPALSIDKSANDTTDVVAGQVITYTYVLTNTGNQTVTNISISDSHNGSGTPPVPLPESAILTDNAPLGDSSNPDAANGVWDRLAPGDSVTMTANYTVTQTDVETLQ
ncbi:MAG: hypothetical protein AAGF54_11665 [Pseudomonadota bacterium]